MKEALVFNATTNLVIGLALMLAWQRDRGQLFTRTLGVAHLAVGVQILIYTAFVNRTGVIHAAAAVVTAGLLMVYVQQLFMGCAQLARRSLSPRRAAVMAAALVAVALLFFVSGSLRLAHAAGAALHLTAGAVVLAWLWRVGRAERLIGTFVLLVGVSQLISTVGGEAALDLQAHVASLVRLALGLTLLYATFSRSAADSERQRRRVVQLTENSHQGLAVIDGENIVYANPAALRMFGARKLDEFGYSWRRLMPSEEEQARSVERFRKLLSGELDTVSWQGERRRADGTPAHLRFTAWKIEWEHGPAVQEVITDETAHHHALEALLRQATHHELTGLPNRSALLQRLRALRAAAARCGPLQALQPGAWRAHRRRGAAGPGRAADAHLRRPGRGDAPGRGRVRAAAAGCG